MRFLYLLRALAILLGSMHTWAAATSYSMNADGISYLDIGDAYMRGDWQMAISSVWSPMYSWIMGLVLNVIKPNMIWEFPVVHIVNFIIYLAALISFEYFWRQLWRYHIAAQTGTNGNDGIGFPEWSWWSIGYLLFITASLNLIQIWSVTPDMLMSIFVYLAAAFLIQIRLGETGWNKFIGLGIVLGAGYLAKSVMLPVTAVFLVVTVVTIGSFRKGIPRMLIALFFFSLLAMPFIAAVSWVKGELNLGDAGTYTYAKHVNGVMFSHWQGEEPGNGFPTHPSRKIYDEPPIYEFGTPIGGTYPINYDPSYWYEGLKVDFNIRQQMRAFLSSGLFYLETIFLQGSGLLVGVLILYLTGSLRPRGWRDAIYRWGLVLISVAIFAFYGLVAVVGRYIGVFVVLLWGDLFANARLPGEQFYQKLISRLSVVIITMMVLNLIYFNFEGYRKLTPESEIVLSDMSQKPPPQWPGEVAEELYRLGIEPGDDIAVIGYAFDSFWARLARVKIVAEMIRAQADPFYYGTEEQQEAVLNTFAGTGARAIVAEYVPDFATLEDWHPVGNSNYFIYLFDLK